MQPNVLYGLVQYLQRYGALQRVVFIYFIIPGDCVHLPGICGFLRCRNHFSVRLVENMVEVEASSGMMPFGVYGWTALAIAVVAAVIKRKRSSKNQAKKGAEQVPLTTPPTPAPPKGIAREIVPLLSPGAESRTCPPQKRQCIHAAATPPPRPPHLPAA